MMAMAETTTVMIEKSMTAEKGGTKINAIIIIDKMEMAATEIGNRGADKTSTLTLTQTLGSTT